MTAQVQAAAPQDVRAITARYGNEEGSVIQMLQDIQNEFGYLSRQAIHTIAEELNVSPNVVYGVATFYTQFKFVKPGRNQVKVCLGTACHVRGGGELMDIVGRRLDLHDGETSADGEFSLDRVACLGCCALAPVVTINDEVHGKMTQRNVSKLVDGLRDKSDD